MAILIDRARWPGRGTKWAHLVSDADIEELHAFAAEAGLPRKAFHDDHYDVPERFWPEIVAAGAKVVESREVVQALRRNGHR